MKLYLSLIFTCISYFQYAQTAHFIPYREGNKWGYCDTSKHVIVKPIYDSVGHFAYNAIYSIIKKNNKVGVYNRLLNSEIISPKYENVTIPYPGGFNESTIFFAKNNGKYGVINDKDKVILNFYYRKIIDVFDRYEKNLISFFMLQKGKKWGIADKNGKILVDCIYDNIFKGPSYNITQEFSGNIGDSQFTITIDRQGSVKTNEINYSSTVDEVVGMEMETETPSISDTLRVCFGIC